MPCVRLSWPSRQLLSAHRLNVEHRIVSYLIVLFMTDKLRRGSQLMATGAIPSGHAVVLRASAITTLIRYATRACQRSGTVMIPMILHRLQTSGTRLQSLTAHRVAWTIAVNCEDRHRQRYTRVILRPDIILIIRAPCWARRVILLEVWELSS